MNKQVIDDFHKLYYNSAVWVTKTKWMGIPAQKCPLDLWIYQEIIYELQPDLIIETGTCYGGSALFMANICKMIHKGMVITIDINRDSTRPTHECIMYITGSSIGPDTLRMISAIVKPGMKVMVILDSDHSRDYVIKEMNCYAPFVTLGSYLIVEDTDVNGHPICPDHGPGPAEAITEFLKTHHEFEVDISREKFLMTQNPGGYLKRIY
jgi:cephalosporin hydroxylase